MRISCKQPNRHGFTLIEILCVLAIIIILSGTTYTIISDVRAKGKSTKTEALLKQIEAGLEAYKEKYGFYPGDYKNLKDIIKPGRPFGAIEEYFICKLNRDLGAKKQYKVFVLNSLTNNNLNSTVYVWVQNGKITSVNW